MESFLRRSWLTLAQNNPHAKVMRLRKALPERLGGEGVGEEARPWDQVTPVVLGPSHLSDAESLLPWVMEASHEVQTPYLEASPKSMGSGSLAAHSMTLGA